MAGNKTKPTEVRVADFLASVTPGARQHDCVTLDAMMRRVTGEDGVMWGPAIAGYGQYHYKYASGREGDFFLTGFSPRKQNLSVYIMSGFGEFSGLLNKLGKHKCSKGSCLYIKKLDDVDLDVLEELVAKSVEWMKAKYGV